MRLVKIVAIGSFLTFIPVLANEKHGLDLPSDSGVTENYQVSLQKQFDYQKDEIKAMEKELTRLADSYRKKMASDKSEYKREIRGGMVNEPGRPFHFIVNESAKIQFSGEKIESILFEKRKSRLEYEFEPYTVLQECKGTISENDLNLELKIIILEPEYKRPVKQEVIQLASLKELGLKLKFLKLYKSYLRDVLFQVELLVGNKIQKTNAGVISSIKVID